jgi:hypothetical protein
VADPTPRHGALDDDRLKTAYLASSDSAAPHLSESEWEQLGCGELSGEALAQAHAHITNCARCTEVHRSLLAMAEGAAQFDPGAVTPHAPRRASRLWMTLGGLAAAAAIFAAVVVDLRVPRTEPAAEVMRNQGGPAAISIVTPQPDAVLQQRRLAWQAVPTAEGYDVRISTADGGAVWSVRTSATDATVPAERALAAGRYYWQVTALRGDAAIASSSLTVFRVE